MIIKTYKDIATIMNEELERQQTHAELIASENFVSEDILKIAGSVLTNKYAEGYPSKRYYGGCEIIDKLEQAAIDYAKKLYDAGHANVQPHSGSQANAAAYLAVLEPGDKVLAMNLDAGGHLTHGHSMNFSGKTYNFISYGVTNDNEIIDYDIVEKIAIKEKPKLIVAGASSYSRTIDFSKFRKIADKVNALLMVDMAHIAGLIAAKQHPSPIPYADIVTTTTHKTLRGPRGGMILCKKELAKKIDSSVFPGTQGGPLEHIIAAKLKCFIEASTKEFVEYQKQIIKNTKIMVEVFKKEGFRIIANGSDNHLLSVDVRTTLGISGKKAENILEQINVVVNKNMIPFDKSSPFITSGIRLGSAALTTRGFKEKDFTDLTFAMSSALKNSSEENLKKQKEIVKKLLKNFPIYKNIKY